MKNNNTAIRDTRLFDALDHIDERHIAAVTDKYEFKDPCGEYVRDTRRLRKAYIKALAAAACLVLITGLAMNTQRIIDRLGVYFPSFSGSGTQIMQTEPDSEVLEETNDAEEAVIERRPTLSEEEKDMLISAHMQRNPEIPKNEYYESTVESLRKEMICVWKKGDMYAVKYGDLELCVMSYETVCGYTFEYGNPRRIEIFKDGKIYSMTDAYNSGIIDEEDVKSTYDFYYNSEEK